AGIVATALSSASPAGVFTGSDTPPSARLNAASSTGSGGRALAKRSVRETVDSAATRPSPFAAAAKSCAARSSRRSVWARACIAAAGLGHARQHVRGVDAARLLELLRVLAVVLLHRRARHGLDEVLRGERRGDDPAPLGLPELVLMRAQILRELVVARRCRGDERPELDQRPGRTDLFATQRERVLDFRRGDLHAARDERPDPPERELPAHVVDVGGLPDAGALEDVFESPPREPAIVVEH